MASISKLTLCNKSITATETSEVKSLTAKSKKFIAVQIVSNLVGGATIQATLEHSPDKINWVAFATLPVRIANGMDHLYEGSFSTANQPLWPNIRAVVTKGGGGSATADIALWFDDER